MATATKRRLLVVEDDPGLNALVTRRLQQAGYEVESVLTGAAALEAVRRNPNALVLLDYLLPDMTAHDIVKRLKAEGQNLRFAVMTGHGDEKVAVELMKLGARDYLVKDSDLGDVLPEVVRHVLGELETEERLAGAETMLMQSEERHRLLLEHAGPGIGYYDPTGRLLLLNQAGAENLNGVPADFVGKTVSELFGAEQGAHILARIGIAVASESGLTYEDHMLLPSGDKWFLSSYRRIPGLSGAEQGVQIVSQDITERKQAEQALVQSELSLRTLALNLPAIVYRVHLRDRNRMQFFNGMLAEMTGYREDELARGEVCSIDPLILPEDRPSVVETVKRATSENQAFRVDYRITHRDGSVRHFSEQGRPVPGADGRPERIDGVIFDTTEARRNEETVRLSQDRLAEAQRTSHIGSWLWDGRKGQSFWSAELYRILGLTPASAPPTQETFLARVHPDDRAYFRARVAEASRDRRSYDFDLRVVRPDGVERHVHGETKVEYDAAGVPMLVTGTCQDVTERKRAEASLRESEEKYRLVVEHANEAILVVQDGLLRFVNPEALQMLGYDREELLNQPFPRFIHPADRALVIDRHQQRLRGEPVPERYVFRVVRRDGAIRWLEIGAALTAWQGKPATLSFLTDVTERELAADREAQQRWNQAFLAETAGEFVRLGGQEDIYQHICARLHTLVGNACVIVNSRDPKTDEFQVRAVTGPGDRLDAVLKLLGRKPEGTVFTLTPEQQQEYASDKLKRIAGGMATLSFGQLPRRLVAALEKASNVGEVYAMTLFYHGAILGTVNILLRRDTVLRDPETVETFVNQAAVALQRRLAGDELRRHQQHLEELVGERTKELKRAQDALVRQERLAAVGKVAGSMAHEIRNPLAAMRNAAYFLNKSLGPKLGGKEARHLEILDQEIDVANGIITSVLDFARGRPAELLPHNLSDVLETARGRTGLPPSVQVRRRLPSDLPKVRVDLQQMAQVFINLLTNASQAMDGKGRVTVAARALGVEKSKVEKSKGQEAEEEVKTQRSEVKAREEVESRKVERSNGQEAEGGGRKAEGEEQGSRVEVRFRDEGPGIAAENLGRVFEPLFSTRTVGIGMGLAVCKAFVEAGDGTIEVESEPGKGATFVVTLPAAE